MILVLANDVASIGPVHRLVNVQHEFMKMTSLVSALDWMKMYVLFRYTQPVGAHGIE